MPVTRLFTDGTDLQLGDKVRFVSSKDHEPYARGTHSWGQFREIIFLTEDYFHLKDHVNPLSGDQYAVTRIKLPISFGGLETSGPPWIWEVQRNVVAYRVDQEPDENEETL
jgi:hypothetical protein